MRSPSPARLASTLLLLVAAPEGALAQASGLWQGPTPLPLPGIHAVVLPPDGQVLYFSYPVDGAGTEAWTLDPDTGALKEYGVNANLFCGGHGHRPNGDILVVGGTMPTHDPQGEEEAFTFRRPGGFVQEQSMADGRWYPSVTKLKSGKLLALSGLDSLGGTNPLVEVWSKSAGWTVLPGATQFLPLYPMAFLAPGGDVFVAGPGQDSQLLDVGAQTWTFVDNKVTAHSEGSAVMLPTPGQFLVVGGHNGSHTKTYRRAERIDLNDADPQWTSAAPMNKKRHHANATLLPDGTVLVTGGERIKAGGEEAAVKRPDLYDPVADTWTLLKKESTPRLYHSTGVLLLDGRVATAGGDDQYSYDVFSPPYLFRGARPSLSGVQAEAVYGESITVTSDQADQVASVCLIAPSAVTHSFNQNQRYVPVDFSLRGQDQLLLSLTTDKSLAPPGYYMLFLVNAAGVPSVGQFLRIKK